MSNGEAFIMGFVFGAVVGAMLFWFFSNYIPHWVVRPKPTPRPPGPFGTQTFPIYPRPGDPDYRTKVEPATVGVIWTGDPERPWRPYLPVDRYPLSSVPDGIVNFAEAFGPIPVIVSRAGEQGHP